MLTPTDIQPGRLQLRFTQLKHHNEQLGRMAESMRAIEGVLMVESVPHTGGFLIQFDGLIGRTAAFWDQIEAVLLAQKLILNPRPFALLQCPLPAAPDPPERPTVDVITWPRAKARQSTATAATASEKLVRVRALALAKKLSNARLLCWSPFCLRNEARVRESLS